MTDYNVEFAETFAVNTFDASKDTSLRLSSQMKMQQDIGEHQLTYFDLDYTALRNRGYAFVVVSTNAVIHSRPLLHETCKMVTWNRGAKRVKFYRCYNWYDAAGACVIEACSSFALVDFKTHKPVRSDVLSSEMASYFDRVNAAGTPKRILLPETMTLSGQKHIFYSLIDYNGHLNNTCYADFITDFMPGGMDGKRIVRYGVDYVREARENDNLRVYTAQQGNTVYFKGEHDRGECFRCYCVFEKDV